MKEILISTEMSDLTGIQPIEINTPVIRNIGPTVINAIEVPVTRPSVPVTRSIRVPIINLPNYEYEYPILNLPPEPITTEPGIPGGPGQAGEGGEAAEETDTRDMVPSAPSPQPIVDVPTGPSIDIAGVEINLPDAGVVATAGSVAVVTTAAGMGATVVLGQLKNSLTPVINELVKKKFKVKIKQVKPVLHYCLRGDVVDILEYSMKGTKVLASTDNVEQYLRDQVDVNSLYEYENKLIIDEEIKDKFTKEGAKRFKAYFAPARVLAKKLSAKFSI